MSKVHYRNAEGLGLCGLSGYVEFTTDVQAVTCARCLKGIASGSQDLKKRREYHGKGHFDRINYGNVIGSKK